MDMQGLTANSLQVQSGIAQSTTSRILNDETQNPRMHVIEKYATFFGIEAADFMYIKLARKQAKMTHPTMARVFEATKKKPAELADEIGTSPQNINNWCNRGISKAGAVTISQRYNIDLSWLLTGDGEMRSTKDDAAAFVASLPSGIYQEDSEAWRLENQVMVSFYDVRFCCGDGAGSYEFEALKKTLPFDQSFFKRRGLVPDNFKMIYALGDSMSPYIHEGDAVGIDVADIEIKDGQVYALFLDGDRMIKRIFKEAGGVLRLSSDNNHYRDKMVDQHNGDSLIIIGKVVYRSG